MSLKDLSGKTVYDLEREDFEKLFCQHCHEYGECPRDDKKLLGCKVFVDSGLWDNFYRKKLNSLSGQVGQGFGNPKITEHLFLPNLPEGGETETGI